MVIFLVSGSTWRFFVFPEFLFYFLLFFFGGGERHRALQGRKVASEKKTARLYHIAMSLLDARALN